ncbi:hypothetical protein C492_17610 [Natronococcus jeotgali DSM 18795]|uniref:Uncharacterized protein n=1 Tax=Natronococcus jeotgali DSM 18795 TaxID=1227498 RepID=L9WV52_9EURY|nr:hypothetical protein C492_17610 [Natronococcus jeotgali DSM 18795]
MYFRSRGRARGAAPRSRFETRNASAAESSSNPRTVSAREQFPVLAFRRTVRGNRLFYRVSDLEPRSATPQPLEIERRTELRSLVTTRLVGVDPIAFAAGSRI